MRAFNSPPALQDPLSEQVVHDYVDNLFRREAGRLTAFLMGAFGPEHLEMAEDVVQETLLKALRQWRFTGPPANPSAWLLQVAKNHARDLLRRDATLRQKQRQIAHWIATSAPSPAESELLDCGTQIHDDRLRLFFMCCHPALAREAQVALTLKSLCGLSVGEIAAAFLAEETTVAQRLVRAKRALREKRVRFDIPDPAALPARLDAVLEVLYLLFNEGYSAHTGESLVRVDLCEEAIYLTRLLVRHPVGDTPRAHALAALMLLQASRLPARVDAEGGVLLLSEQDRALWDRARVREGIAYLQRAASGIAVTSYHLEAGIAAIHAVAPCYEATDWPAVLAMYDALRQQRDTLVVNLNRAIALAHVQGVAVGLEELERVGEFPEARAYHFYHAARASLYAERGEQDRARTCYAEALNHARTEPERRFLQRRIDQLDEAGPSASDPA